MAVKPLKIKGKIQIQEGWNCYFGIILNLRVILKMIRCERNSISKPWKKGDAKELFEPRMNVYGR